MSRPRGSGRGLYWVLAAVGVLMVLEVALVVAVFVSPNASARGARVSASVTRFLMGTRKSPGALERVSTGARNLAAGWAEVLTGDRYPPSRPGEFHECVSCHADYASKDRFATTYMDHAKHAELGVACATCHEDTEHPSPYPPQESTCAKCHEVNDQKSCSTCHSPGALPHFYRLGFAKEGIVECDACHPRGAYARTGPPVALPTVDPQKRETCASCHPEKKCASCHQTHPRGWRTNHGESYLAGVVCSRCHTGPWCSDSCHNDRSKLDAVRARQDG